MWNFASGCIAGTMGLKKEPPHPKPGSSDCSDDEASSSAAGREEGLECPICWESFNIVENVPYVLWCGHTLCKNCILGLQWAVVKFPTLPIQLPLFISCPWCSLLSFRLVYRGALRFPRKNYFLLWMVESMNGDRVKNQASFSEDRGSCPTWSPGTSGASSGGCGLWRTNHHHHSHRAELVRPEERGPPQPRSDDHLLGFERLHLSIKKSLFLFVHLTAKFPLVLIFLMIVLYAIPASAAILALYVLVTVLFALPSFLILYFSYPTLDWLVREIVT